VFAGEFSLSEENINALFGFRTFTTTMSERARDVVGWSKRSNRSRRHMDEKIKLSVISAMAGVAAPSCGARHNDRQLSPWVDAFSQGPGTWL
jgi:hypothetical protein